MVLQVCFLYANRKMFHSWALTRWASVTQAWFSLGVNLPARISTVLLVSSYNSTTMASPGIVPVQDILYTDPARIGTEVPLVELDGGLMSFSWAAACQNRTATTRHQVNHGFILTKCRTEDNNDEQDHRTCHLFPSPFRSHVLDWKRAPVSC